jgi:CheY-like chemotaxis protein
MAAATGDEVCVLVVDDDEGIRETLRDVVETAGCSVILAANGEEALGVLETRRPCLIILDLMMPTMTGFEMLRAMQERPELAALPVVISTSAPALAPAGIPVLSKPIDIGALWVCMARACGCAPTTDRSGETAETRKGTVPT